MISWSKRRTGDTRRQMADITITHRGDGDYTGGDGDYTVKCHRCGREMYADDKTAAIQIAQKHLEWHREGAPQKFV